MEKEEIAKLLGAEIVATDLDLFGGILFGVNYLVNERRKRSMPNVDRECITHHAACDCREAAIERLINAIKSANIPEEDCGAIETAIEDVSGFWTTPRPRNESYNDGFRDGEQSAQRKYEAEIKRKNIRVKELESRIEELKNQPQWQPMDTAPKTGEWVFALLEIKPFPGQVQQFRGIAQYWKQEHKWVSYGPGRPVAWLPSPPIKEDEK